MLSSLDTMEVAGMLFYNRRLSTFKSRIKAWFNDFIQTFKDLMNPEYEEEWEMFPEDFDTEEEWEEYKRSLEEGDDNYENKREV